MLTTLTRFAFAAAAVFPLAPRDTGGPVPAAPPPPCDQDNGGITLPDGFCATVFADNAGAARHITVAPNGDVFVALSGAPKDGPKGGVLALRDTRRRGHADKRESFGTAGGTGILYRDGYLYLDAKSAIVRYRLPAGRLQPVGIADTLVTGLPTGGHGAHNFAIGRDGALYVNVGSQTNACQPKDRTPELAGTDPCTELETRAGIWKFDSKKKGQVFSPSARFATGIRNAVGLTVSPLDGALYATQHGRDQLFQNWPKFYDADAGAEEPQEQLMRVSAGEDYGWPYCYFDGASNSLLLAPEYGGDRKQVGRCAEKKTPIAHFPGHWAPESIVIYNGGMFPARYHGGAFIAFHGSWNRAPKPQAGYRVVFVPMTKGTVGAYETFADGFAGGKFQPGEALHRPMGMAQGPDGALYITDDAHGRIWKVVYRGSR
ncbi:MAG: sorbosone dehydrogenase family protein [Gemmatimonadaceae bacterium]